MKNKSISELVEYAKQQLQSGVSIEQLEQHLVQQTGNDSLSSEVLAKIKKERHEVSMKKGLIKIGIAATLLLSSFIYSCINFHSNESFTLVMYGFTSIGTVLLVWGCYDIFN